MSVPGFVIVCKDERGTDTSVLTAVLDEQGNQKIVSLSDAGHYRPIPCPSPEGESAAPQETSKTLPKPNYVKFPRAACRYKCDKCHESFTKSSQLRTHRLKIHQVGDVNMTRQQATKQTFSCTLCGSVFETILLIQEHLSNTHKEVNASEEELQEYIVKKTNRIGRLSQADKKRTEELEKLVVKDAEVASQISQELEELKNPPPKRRPYVPHKKYTCAVCNKAFSSPSLLSRHDVVHTGAKLYPCPHCNKRCSFTDERLRHIRRAHPAMVPAVSSRASTKRTLTSYTCKTCGDKTFTTRARYVEHLKVHLGGLFQCHLCPKRFAKRDNQLRHIAAHWRVKKHQCDECGKYFGDPQHLRRHRQIHTGDLPHKCPICSKGFGRKHTLYQHLQNHHEENTSNKLQCRVCWDLFEDEPSLEEHQKLHGLSDYRNKQNSPSAPFKSPGFTPTIIPVIKAIPFTPPVTYTPPVKSTQATHVNVKATLPTFDCSVCKQSFRSAEELKLHGGIHVSEKPRYSSHTVFPTSPSLVKPLSQFKSTQEKGHNSNSEAAGSRTSRLLL